MISAAEAVAGFPMEDETLSVFITDNAAPEAGLSSISASVSMDSIASVIVEFAYGEVLSTDSIMYSVSSDDFDDFMVKLPQEADSEMSTLTFTPMNGTMKLEEQQIEFDVTITMGTDLAGNEVNSTVGLVVLND